MIVGDEILDDQGIYVICPDAASLTVLTFHLDPVPLDDIPFGDRSPIHVDAASSARTHVVGDHIVEDLRAALRGSAPQDADSGAGSSDTDIGIVAGDGIHLY